MIIAIDGPSGAGKSTVSKAVARRLGFSCLDTGAMYRSIAWQALQDGVSLEDGEALGRIADMHEIGFSHEPGDPLPRRVSISGVDVTDAIRFLREREIVHFQRFGEGLRLAKDRMDQKNLYFVNPSFD